VNLDDPHTLTRKDHGPTSHDAASAVLGRTGSARRRVLEVIAAYREGLTDEEISERLKMPPNTQRPRRVELVRAGFIEDSGFYRYTTTFNRAVLWVATDAGREALRT
jgi:hypothetical protein